MMFLSKNNSFILSVQQNILPRRRRKNPDIVHVVKEVRGDSYERFQAWEPTAAETPTHSSHSGLEIFKLAFAFIHTSGVILKSRESFTRPTMSDGFNFHHEESETLREAVSERYLQYALSTIMNRALPDARDGLKPVHRRILFAMRELKLSPNGPFRKSAKIAGDVMGNFHPHGNQAIYDALVRLAQDFNMRYPLVDGQGNFGNIDGDGAAAERYTEARLTMVAEALMEGLDEEAVDFRPNYDGSRQEPEVLPAKIPNLLANGASGIAVGMATHIPPHNIGELCDACLHLLKMPEARDATLLNYVKGPDFPTGGVIIETPEKIKEAYQTGRGFIRVRARWDVEKLDRGHWQIVVTEIPYQVQKSRLIERIADLIQNKKVPMVTDIRDESVDDVRIVLEPKSRSVDPDLLMESLFRHSDLENRFSLNLNVLIDGKTPRVCSLKTVLLAFLNHRREVLLRRSRYRLSQIDKRVEIIEGYLVVFHQLDRIIEIIRFEDSPKLVMMEEFTLTEGQAEAILNMRLRNLRKLEEIELSKELDLLLRERADIEDLLEDESIQTRRLASEMKDAKKQFGSSGEKGERRTTFAVARIFDEIPSEVMIEKEPITVICSEAGWIRAIKGAVSLTQEFRYRDGDAGRFVFHAQTTDRLILSGENGRFYTLNASSLPGGRSLGEPVRLMVDLPNDSLITDLWSYVPTRKRVLASSSGYAFVVNEDDMVAGTRNGKQVMNLRDGESLRAAVAIENNGDHVAMIGENGKFLIFAITELPTLVRGRGNIAQKYTEGGLEDLCVFNISDGLQWYDSAGRQRTVKDLAPWLGKRGRKGVKPPRGYPRLRRLAAMKS